MKWTYSLTNKSVASVALLLLCLLVLWSNRIDRDHTTHVRKSITTLYEDRLVAETHILKMTNDLYQIKEILSTIGSNRETGDNKIANLLSDIHQVSQAYQNTKLTVDEHAKFIELSKITNAFKISLLQGSTLQAENANKAIALLNELSVIQLEESKLIMSHAETLFFSGVISTQFAFAVVIVILLVLQALVFTSKTLIGSHQTSAAYLN
jgi:hypothetical protein